MQSSRPRVLSPSISWSTPPAALRLLHGQVDIWRINLETNPDVSVRIQNSLSPYELERGQRFHFQEDRDRYVAAHGCLRDILSRYLSLAPRELQFRQGRYGKPELEGPGAEEHIEFNLSHSGLLVLIGVTLGSRIGVDVERHRTDVAAEELARHYFSPAEVAELSSLAGDERLHAFYNGWSRKEAYIKAHGLGLSLALDSFDVSLTFRNANLLCATRPHPGEVNRWTIRDLEVRHGYSAAAAVEGPELGFRYWDWQATRSE